MPAWRRTQNLNRTNVRDDDWMGFPSQDAHDPKNVGTTHPAHLKTGVVSFRLSTEERQYITLFCQDMGFRPCLRSRVTQASTDGGDMQGVEERTGELVVACCDGTVDLQMTDHALDAVSFEIDAPVPADRSDPVGSRRDNGPNAALAETVANGGAVVSLIGQQMIGLGVGQGYQVVERRAVGRFAAREVEGERDAGGITETMNFTGEPAPRATKSLFASPPFAPAAETWPRTVVLSMLWRELSAIAWARVVAAASQMPASRQRLKRWYMVIHFPYFSGTSRQGAPVRVRQRMPLMMGRLSDAGRLLRPRSGGNRSFRMRHSASLRSPRLKNASSPKRILESRFDSGVKNFVNRA